MEGSKPLIFIKPYTKTVAKLVEVLQESSEDQGTEIYEIEDLQEAIQLLPQIGQSLVIAAHPRKTAMLLQACKTHIKKLQSKTLLISPKPIPRRTIDKFMKVGLTECIVEPIVPKTLQYKVNLLIRSIVIKKEEVNFEKKFDADSAAEEADIEVKEIQRKQREALEASKSKNHDSDDSDEEDLYARKKEKQKEASIDGYYKGKMKKSDAQDDSDEEDDESSHSENHIEGYYKGKIAVDENHDEDTDENDEKTELQIEEDDINQIANKVNLLLTDDDELNDDDAPQIQEPIKTTKKAAPKLTLEEEREAKLKAEVTEDIADLDDLASAHLELINDLSDKKEDTSSEEENNNTKAKKKTQLDIEAELPKIKESNKQASEQEIISLKKSKKLNIEDDQDPEEEEDLYGANNKPRKNKAVATHLDLEEDNEESSEDSAHSAQNKHSQKQKKTDLEIMQDALDSINEDTESTPTKKNKKKESPTLEIEKEKNVKEDSDSSDQDEDIYGKKNKVQLNVKDDGLYEQGIEEKNTDKQRDARGSGTELEIDDDSARNKQKRQEESGYAQRSSGFTENIQERAGNRADAHADKIKTHYDSRQGLKHGDDEWHGVERESQFDDTWKRNKKNEFIMPEKEAFGEQTIDYSDLKKQFDAIEYELSGKKASGEFEEDEAKAKILGFAHSISTQEESESEEEQTNEEGTEENHEGPIHEAQLKSSPSLVKALRLYLNTKVEREVVLRSILELIRDDLGVLVMIKYGKGPKDGKVKVETFEDWLDEETKNEIINLRPSATGCPILPQYSDKTFEEKKTHFYFPFTEGISTFAWAECYLPAGTSEEGLKQLEAVLETARGVLLDEFHELGGTGPYAEIKKKKEEETEAVGAKVVNFFGKLFGKKKAG